MGTSASAHGNTVARTLQQSLAHLVPTAVEEDLFRTFSVSPHALMVPLTNILAMVQEFPQALTRKPP